MYSLKQLLVRSLPVQRGCPVVLRFRQVRYLSSPSSSGANEKRSEDNVKRNIPAGDARRHVRIGHVQVPMGREEEISSARYLIPSLYLPSYVSSVNDWSSTSPSNPSSSRTTFLRHLQWMMAKDALQQDMMLVGPPGSNTAYRRRLVMAYAELTQKPIEVVNITADLTESDLKQRRELVQGSNNGNVKVQFVDQAPVRAAKHGRLLLLDGLEKAERNVLPTLNNLLENREMHLEDGSLLLPPHRVQALLQDDTVPSSSSSSSSLSSFWIPVHPDFRVIALTVPSPPFPGRSLDPPIRSRFQIRRIDNPTSVELYEQMVASHFFSSHELDGTAGQEDLRLAEEISILASAMDTQDRQFPVSCTESVARVVRDFPLEDRSEVLYRSFPQARYDESSFSIMKSFCGQSWNRDSSVSKYEVVSIVPAAAGNGREVVCRLHGVSSSLEGKPLQDHSEIRAASGGEPVMAGSQAHIVQTLGFRRALGAMVQEHGSGNRDILLVAPKGEGKNALVHDFASLLGYKTHLFPIYIEMTIQDLLLRRATDPVTGETKWEESPLLQAARQGDLCILDGVEKLRPDVLSSLQSLMLERELPLPDGRKVSTSIRQHVSLCDDKSSMVLTVHPSFRVVGLASSAHRDEAASAKWVTPDVLSMFGIIRLPEPTDNCLRAILKHNSHPACPNDVIESIIALRRNLTKTVAVDCGVSALSTRDMIRAVRRMKAANASEVYSVLSSIFLLELLPLRQRNLLGSVLRRSGIEPSNAAKESDVVVAKLKLSIYNDHATIGSLKIRRGPVDRPEMVPSPRAFDIPAHLRIIRDLLEDWKNGERFFLLLGSQGVGKNVIIDRICEIANWEREYLQLHRDSTIGQLTLTPQLEDGKIVWKDSPLIRAVRDGCVLVVDEADKAPLEVVAVLKGLIEDGELLLADGRRISTNAKGPGIINMHENFSLWVLANRPGFPFLGNDFFREIGDCFSTRVIQNPDLNSEMHLLRSYAPRIDDKTIQSIAASFAELRRISDKGDLSYPYSTREAIAVVKHLEKYENDGIVSALHNVLDFDSFDEQTYSMLGEVFQKHGVPVSDYASWKEAILRAGEKASGVLGIEYLDSDQNRIDGTSTSPPDLSMPNHGKWDEKNEAHVGGNQWAGGTGGSDTAGLGGRGGPYRLDRGHRIHQVSDEAKRKVSEKAKEAGKKMAKDALDARLNEIGMGEERWEVYQRFSAPIRKDIAKLKSVLDSIELRSSERGWLKRQSHGEIDDSRLVDSLAGDRYIYKRRGSLDESPIPKKKHIRFVLDISGSMYRFNSMDSRLFRCLEAALLVMESFDGASGSKFEWSMVGHSGDSERISLVEWAKPPPNENERVKVLLSMLAHSQYCYRGDHTLEATMKAIEDVASRVNESAYRTVDGNDGDEGIVICLSDANLARYGIDSCDLERIIQGGDKQNVKTFVIFIASFGDEAEDISRSLAVGRGHTCMHTSELPRVVRDILASQVLK